MIKRLCLYGILLTVSAPAAAFDIDELRTLIRERDLDSVAAVVAHLPHAYRGSYTLAYDSAGLQESSFEHPRAILFGRTAQLVLSFNGHPEQRRYHTIEAMQYREEAESFELYVIEFSGGRVRFSSPNPEVCASCHGSPPHPVWSSYEYAGRETGHWPGLYGATHDAPVLNAREAAAFQSFRERAGSHPRYRHLVRDRPGQPWFPYGTGPREHRLRPNNRLGNLLARWRARQVVAQIDAAGVAERHPAVAQAWLLQCPGVDRADYRRRARALFRAGFPAADHARVHERLESLAAEQRTAFMMERLLTGSAASGWTMNIEPSAPGGSFDTGIVTLDGLVAARWLATREPGHRLKRYYEAWGSRELYNTFEAGYFRENVAPGGVGAAYDRVAGYYDPARARRACPSLARAPVEQAAAR